MFKDKIKWTDAATLFLSFVVALAATIQLIVFFKSERASVAPIKAYFAVELLPGIASIPLSITFKNGGKSTATIDELAAAITENLPPSPIYTTAPKFAVPPIFANGEVSQDLPFETGWGQKVIDEMKSENRKLYLFGRIKYHDQLGFFREHETGFCFRYSPGKQPTFQTCLDPQFTYMN